MDYFQGLASGVYQIVRWSFIIAFWILKLPFRLGRRMHRKGGTHGSARWSTRFEQWWHGAIRGEGVILGRGAFGRLVRFSKDGMVMVFATMGAGKGIGVVVPSLLTYRGSMLVTDPKGENYAITRRRRQSFGKVRMLNPSNLAHSERFNPMDIIRVGTPNEADDARGLASLMMKHDGRESHWDDKAESTLQVLILHALQEPPPSRTLATVRRLSVGSKETLIDTLQDIMTTSASMAAREIASGVITSSIDTDGAISDEFKSILSNLHKATEPWSAGAPAGMLSGSTSFALSELVTEVSTLYLCVEEDLLEVYELWLRVMVGCVLKTLTRAKAARPKRKVVLLLDEVAVLGRLEPLEKQSGLLRAYCTPVLIWQNMPQVERVYGQAAESFLANSSARVFFGINDNNTGQYVATMVGHTTNMSSSFGVSKSDGGLRGANRQEGQSESGYYLIDSSEVQRLPLHRAIIKFRHVPYSIICRRIDYRRVWRWRGLWDRWDGSPVEGFSEAPVLHLEPVAPEAPAYPLQRPAAGSGLSAGSP